MGVFVDESFDEWLGIWLVDVMDVFPGLVPFVWWYVDGEQDVLGYVVGYWGISYVVGFQRGNVIELVVARDVGCAC